MTYTRVAQNATPQRLVARDHSERVDAFLLDHYKELHAKAERDDSPTASFVDPTTQDLFRQLRTGTDDQFYGAAHTLATRLIGEMDGRTEPGLMVCLRVEAEKCRRRPSNSKS
jgi:hypothetical protein